MAACTHCGVRTSGFDAASAMSPSVIALQMQTNISQPQTSYRAAQLLQRSPQDSIADNALQ